VKNFLKTWFTDYDGNQERVELLRRISLFDEFTENQYRIMADLLYERNYHAEETIFSHGDPASALFIINEGAVEIHIDQEGEQEQLIAELSEGDFFGERALCKELNRTATARTTEETTLLVLFRPEVMGVVRREKDLGIQFLLNLTEILGERLDSANKRILDLVKESSSDDS